MIPGKFNLSNAVFYSKPEAELLGNRLCLFSYGSGLQASMYSIRITSTKTEAFSKLLNGVVGVPARLNSRQKIDPSVFSKTMKLREEVHHKGKQITINLCTKNANLSNADLDINF